MNKEINYEILRKYKGQKVLVTGGAGFIGSNLVRKLDEMEAKITILDDLFTGSLDNLKGLNNYKFIQGDIRDSQLIKEIVKEFDYIFHLAARNIIISTKNPQEDYAVNIGGTLNLLMALRDHSKLKKYVYTSSVSIYGNARYLPINEDDPYNLLNPYAVSKLSGENYSIVFYENYNLPVSVVRYSNVYGDFQSAANPYCGVIGKFIENLKNNKPLCVHGDGEQTRDFTYVEDSVEATLLAGILDKSTGEIFNIGTGVEVSINNLIQTLIKVSGKNDAIVDYINKRDIDNIRRRVVNIEKIRHRLRWFPQYNLLHGLAKTLEWYDSFHPKI